MARDRKKWSDLTPGQRIGIVVGGFIQFALMALAQWDLTRRSSDRVKGPKVLWRLVVLINFFGPIAYFLIGRKKDSD